VWSILPSHSFLLTLASLPALLVLNSSPASSISFKESPVWWSPAPCSSLSLSSSGDFSFPRPPLRFDAGSWQRKITLQDFRRRFGVASPPADLSDAPFGSFPASFPTVRLFLIGPSPTRYFANFFLFPLLYSVDLFSPADRFFPADFGIPRAFFPTFFSLHSRSITSCKEGVQRLVPSLPQLRCGDSYFPVYLLGFSPLRPQIRHSSEAFCTKRQLLHAPTAVAKVLSPHQQAPPSFSR